MEPDVPAGPKIPIVLPNAPMTFEEAEVVLKNNLQEQQHLIDNVYPWWATLKVPLFVLSIVFATLCLAVIFLAVTLRQATYENDVEYREDACYDRYNVIQADAVARVRASASAVDNAGWYALVSSANGVEITQETVDEVDMLITRSEEALVQEAARAEERQIWLEAGKPLPCPVD